jgi:Glycosyl transferases group 1/Glycosyl transferase 4-like domain
VDSGRVDPELTSMSDQMRCLWISRHIPFPPVEGSRVYSANLAQSLARAGAFVRFMGLGDANTVPESAAGVEWLAVRGKRRNKVFAAFGELPIAAAVDATKAYGALLEEQLREPWDALVLDSYAAGWALERCLRYRNERLDRAPVLVHVSHNHEEALWGAMAREAGGSAPKRWALRRNANQAGLLERRIIRSMDLVTAITDEDRRSLSAGADHIRMLTLTPGYNGWAAGERRITSETPRRVIIMSSFHWVVKQENIARFLKAADPVFKEHGIELDLVGEMPPALLAALRPHCRATHFHGFLTDVAPLLRNARIGIVHESIGGGFKLKLLDYIFARLPVATVSQAVAGLSDELGRAMLTNSSQEGLIDDIVSHIDRFDELNRMQERAFSLGSAQFQWSARGERFRQAIVDVRQPGTATQAARTPSGTGWHDIDLAATKRRGAHV